MSSFLKIVAYFLGTLLLGALLAPPLFWGGQALGHAWPPLHWLTETDFQRYFDRAMLVAALALLWPAVRSLNIAGWRDLGLARDPHALRHAVGGFVLTGGGLWLLGLFLWQQGVYAPRALARVPWGALPGFLVAAAAVAALEEGFFRGALQGLIGRHASAVGALWVVAALFAVLHFLKPPEGATAPAAVGWTTGFAYLPKAFWQWSDPRLVLGGFVTLFAVALVLGYARLRTRALWLPAGLHAGWVFGVKSFAAVSKHTAENSFWFGEDLRYGLGSVLVVGFTGALVAEWLRRENRRSAESDPANEKPMNR